MQFVFIETFCRNTSLAKIPLFVVVEVGTYNSWAMSRKTATTLNLIIVAIF